MIERYRQFEYTGQFEYTAIIGWDLTRSDDKDSIIVFIYRRLLISTMLVTPCKVHIIWYGIVVNNRICAHDNGARMVVILARKNWESLGNSND